MYIAVLLVISMEPMSIRVMLTAVHMADCQVNSPFLGLLDVRGPTIRETQKRTSSPSTIKPKHVILLSH